MIKVLTVTELKEKKMQSSCPVENFLTGKQ